MPFDPLSALSVAGSIVQFVDFASKIVCKGKLLYKSTDGALSENIETETVAIRLQELTNGLLKPLVRFGSITEEEYAQQQRLHEICKECSDISKEVLARLGNLKVPTGVERRRWKSFRQALKSVWSKQAIDALATRLKELRCELDAQMLVLLRQVQLRFNLL